MYIIEFLIIVGNIHPIHSDSDMNIYIYEYYIKDTGHIESPFPMILMVLESNHIPNIVC